jgi:hypothetical protein
MLGPKAYRFGNFPDESRFTRREQVRCAYNGAVVAVKTEILAWMFFAVTGVGHPETGDDPPYPQWVQKSVIIAASSSRFF